MNHISVREAVEYLTAKGALIDWKQKESSSKDLEVLLTSPNSFHAAERGEVTFLSRNWIGRSVSQTNASLVITDDTIFESQESQVIVLVEQPRYWFSKLCQSFFLSSRLDTLFPAREIEPKLREQGRIGENCSISDYAFLNPNIYIGNSTIIHPGVTIYGNSSLADGVLVEPSAVIGKSGFAFERLRDQIVALPHYGGVKLGSNVRVGSQSCIDRGTFGNTEIHNDVMVDNLVHVAHNVIIRERTLVVAGAVLCGSSEIGSDVWIGAGAVIRESLTIGDNALVGMGAVVVRDVDEADVVVGNPARRLKPA